MGLFNIGKPRVSSERFARGSFDDILSDKWANLLRDVYYENKAHLSNTQITEQRFIDVLLGASIQLVIISARYIDLRKLLSATLVVFEKEYKHKFSLIVIDAKEYFAHANIENNNQLQVHDWMAIACARRLGAGDSYGLITFLRNMFAGLMQGWIEQGKKCSYDD